jgi:outer membrane biosynthesis protein TonB
VEPRQIIRSSIAASAVVHLSFLLMLIFFTEVHPFGAITPDTVSVDIVTPDEVTEKPSEPLPSSNSPNTSQSEPQTKAKGSDAFDLSATAAPAPASSPPANPPPATPPSPPAASPPAAPQQAAKPSQPPAQKQAALPQPAAAPTPDRRQPAAQPQAQPPTPAPAYLPPEPDISVKYQVLLGLPQDRPGDGFDAPAIEQAAVGSSPIAEFRRHLKTCSTLPKEIAASDKVAIKLRVSMTPDGRLAAEPLLIEASASMKGPLLMQSAISALQSCQPYAMLPADKYNEWKVLDLSFTPQDFGGAS